MKILALVLARSGSKRLPGKNIRLLGGRPLISWSLDIVKSIPEICQVMVSTDDAKIRLISEASGAYVPWLRPYELATDVSSSADAAFHALNWYESNHGDVDGILILQPTSPFRTRKTIKKGIRMFSESGLRTILGVSPTHAHPGWTFQITEGSLSPFIKDHGLNSRSQDLEPAYVVNGSFYLISSTVFKSNKSFITNDMIPLVVKSRMESLDIDTEDDWKYAEFLLNAQSDSQ